MDRGCSVVIGLVVTSPLFRRPLRPLNPCWGLLVQIRVAIGSHCVYRWFWGLGVSCGGASHSRHDLAAVLWCDSSPYAGSIPFGLIIGILKVTLTSFLNPQSLSSALPGFLGSSMCGFSSFGSQFSDFGSVMQPNTTPSQTPPSPQ